MADYIVLRETSNGTFYPVGQITGVDHQAAVDAALATVETIEEGEYYVCDLAGVERFNVEMVAQATQI